jgi:hypothetical protein
VRSKLQKRIQRDIVACISGYTAVIPRPLRERLTEDLRQRVADKFNKQHETNIDEEAYEH